MTNDFDTIKKDVYDSILSSSKTGDHAVARRMLDILEKCEVEAHTIDELAEEYEMHYQTIYTDVRFLLSLGVLDVSPRKRHRKNTYVTNWSLVSQRSDVEMRWRTSKGEFVAVSSVVEMFLGLGAKNAKVATREFGEALVSLRENRRRQAQGQENYGDAHNAACVRLMNENIEWFKALLFACEQAVGSPVVSKEEGWEMYKLPESVTEEEASTLHDKLEMTFQNAGWYEGK